MKVNVVSEYKGVTRRAEGEIDSPCVRFFTCPLPVLVILLPNAWHDVNRKMKTSYWHPASASPSSSASCLPPSASHFLSPPPPYLRLSFPSCGPFPSLLALCFFFFLTFSILCLETFLMIITLTFPPSSPNLQVLIGGRTWNSQLDLLLLLLPCPLSAIHFFLPYYFFVLFDSSFCVTKYDCLRCIHSLSQYKV